MKLSDVKSTGDSIFIPALEQNMMGAVLINDNDEVLFCCGKTVGIPS